MEPIILDPFQSFCILMI